MAVEDLYITDELQAVAARVKDKLQLPVLNFQFGEDEHIIKAMKDMKKENLATYPMIGVVLPVDVQKGNAGGYYGKVTFPRIIIATVTNPGHSTEKRMTDVIKAFINPIYNQFLIELYKQSKTFVIMSPTQIKHTSRIRFGTQTAAQGFTEYLDGIEILNMEFPVKHNIC